MKSRLIILLCLSGIFVSRCGKDDGGTETPTPPTPPTPPAATDPGKSELSTPSNNEVCYDGVDESEQNSLVNFTWQSSSDTDSYDLIIVNQETNISQTESGI